MNEKESRQLKGALELYINEEYEKIEIIEDCEFSDDFKREINKIFREYFGSEKVPHPEVEE